MGEALRIAIDIDSTLHHYWDQFAAAAKRRFGVDLPYEHQVTWHIGQLRPEQVHACIVETHTEPNVLKAEPYPGAVDVISRWHGRGPLHPHHDPPRDETHGHTEQWLARIGLTYDELYCSFDKVSRCTEIGIDVLIDDSPVNLQKAIDAGITPATIVHPWNRDLIEEEDVIAADDWSGLEEKLATVLR